MKFRFTYHHDSMERVPINVTEEDGPAVLLRVPVLSKRGGPRKPIDLPLHELYQLARLGCTQVEASQFFGVDNAWFSKVLNSRPVLLETWNRGVAQSKISLRRLQLAHASTPGAPGVAMTIHMSKHHLDEHDKQQVAHTGENGGPVKMTFSFDSPTEKAHNAGIDD